MYTKTIQAIVGCAMVYHLKAFIPSIIIVCVHSDEILAVLEELNKDEGVNQSSGNLTLFMHFFLLSIN